MAECFPSNGLPRLGQHKVGVLPAVGLGKPGTERNPDPVELDLCLPDSAVRRLADDLPGPVAGDRLLCALGVLDHERAYLAVVIPRPDPNDSGHGAVTDPTLLAIEHPLVAIPAGPGLQCDHVAAVIRL